MYEARDAKRIEELERRIDVACKILSTIQLGHGEAAARRKSDAARAALQDAKETDYESWLCHEYSSAANTLKSDPTRENAYAYRTALSYCRYKGWRWMAEDQPALLKALAEADDR